MEDLPDTPFEIDPATLTLDELVLGRGAWGVVRAGTLTRAGRPLPVAVKQLLDLSAHEERAQLRKEIRVLALASHRCTHVCQLLGTSVKDGRLCVVMPRYACSLAEELLRRPGRTLPEARGVALGLQMCRALVQLHAVPIVVQDLKPSNLLLDEHGGLVVADFGISTCLGNHSKYMPSQIKGTTNYMAPEAFDPEEFGGVGPPADIWSAGCCLLEMLDGKAPWEGERHQVVARKVCDKRMTPPLPPSLSKPIATLLAGSFQYLPSDRLTAAECVARLETIAAAHPLPQRTPLSKLIEAHARDVAARLALIAAPLRSAMTPAATPAAAPAATPAATPAAAPAATPAATPAASPSPPAPPAAFSRPATAEGGEASRRRRQTLKAAISEREAWLERRHSQQAADKTRRPAPSDPVVVEAAAVSSAPAGGEATADDSCIDIQPLVAMGFDQSECWAAFLQAGGDVRRAAALLCDR
ncbi:hypothetical protein AB1Y20_021088 [Prymnesium parvum]|uniref:Protein kinase domain-containing protein n=1 Tax=Prymnesium parvum TaxID=97485 RepID=A0AB34JLA4_PRYPA